MRTEICIIFLIVIVQSFFCKDSEDETFVPSSEWKEIKRGQKIPAGLHVRINLETGKKEAKLVDDEATSKEKSQSLSVVAVGEEKQNEEIGEPSIPLSEIRETLKRIKNDENEAAENIKKKFRSYEQIKEEFDALNLIPKLDSEVINELIDDFKKEFSANENNTKIKIILEDLEYLSHQIDNAIEFVNKNGFKEIVYKTLNNSDVELKQSSLRLMSSLMQNNPKVQIHGLETGAVRELLKLLSFEKSRVVKYQAIAALSSILRRFPLAQKRFVETGGLAVFSKMFEQGDVKINVKLNTLLSDLISEHQNAKKNDDEKESLKQYDQINIEETLVAKHSWCENINKLLYTLVATDENNHDYVEKCLRSMNIIAGSCANSYDVKILNYLSKKFNQLGIDDIDEREEESLSGYFSELKDLCDDLIKMNKSKTEL